MNSRLSHSLTDQNIRHHSDEMNSGHKNIYKCYSEKTVDHTETNFLPNNRA